MLENYDLLVDKKVLNLADFKEKDVFAILALLLRNQQVMSVARVVEEEDNVGNVLATLKLIGDDKKALLMLDKDLATRTFVAPVIG